MLRVLLLLFVALACVAPLHAEEPDDEALRENVRGWIKDLRSTEFAVREEARKNLMRDGLKARDLLEEAQEDEDAEVRRTIRAILARADGTGGPVYKHVQAGQLDQMHLVTLPLKEAPLSGALAALGERMGCTFEVPADARETPVTVEAIDEPPFEVLQRLLAAGGLRMAKPIDRGNVCALQAAGDAPTPPRAAAGPVQVEVVEVTATRPLDSKDLPRYALKIRLHWIPLVQISQYETPRVEVARDPEGNAFKSGAGRSRTTTYGTSSSMRHATLTVNLTPGTAACGDRLAVLEFVLPVTRMQHDQRRVVLDDLGRIPVCLDTEGTEVDPGSADSVLFDSFARSDDGRGQWVADLTATLLQDVSQRTVQAWLREEGGRVQPLYVAGGRSRSADGTIRLTARAFRSDTRKPAGLRVSWFAREGSGNLRFRLTDIPLR